MPPSLYFFAFTIQALRLRTGLLFVAILSGIAAAPGASQEPYRVGALYWSMNIPGQVAMRKGLEAEVSRINEAAAAKGSRSVDLIAHVAGNEEDGIERQIAQMNQLVAARVDIIIVQPTDNAALAQPLRAANAAGIPVVAYDQYIRGGELAAYLTSDNYQAGYLNGEYIAHSFPNEHTIQLILVEYPHVSSTVERVNGLLDALHAQEQPFNVLRSYVAVEPVSGKAAGESILRDFPDAGSVDVVFTVNDGGGLAVVDVLAGAGRNEIFVATIDGDPASVKNIESNRLTRIDAAQFCGALGAEAMKTAYRILQGESVASHTLIPVFPITAETREQYKGWMGPVPDAFEKPWPSKNPIWEGEPKAVDHRD